MRLIAELGAFVVQAATFKKDADAVRDTPRVEKVIRRVRAKAEAPRGGWNHGDGQGGNPHDYHGALRGASLREKIMAIDLYDMILGAGVMFLIYATIKYFKKNKRFVHCETTEGECSEVRSIRYNFIVCMNRYFYAYTVDGVFYSGEDSEAFWFRYKRRNLTNPVTVEYLKDSPETSRLAAVNHKNELQVIMILFLAVAAFVYLVLRKNGIL